MMKALSLCLLASVSAALFPSPTYALEIDPWARVLDRHVRNGRMDYAALAKDEDSRRELALFLRGIGKMSEDESLANWVNVYNALVVVSVLERYPVASVRDVSGIFDGTRHRVAGTARTLDEIERTILIDRFKDSRIHAAICYGAVSSPPLMHEPFRAETLDATLNKLSQQLVANPSNIRLDGTRLWASSLFFWFTDFARDAETTLGWLKRHALGRLASVADNAPMFEINYDWSLAAP